MKIVLILLIFLIIIVMFYKKIESFSNDVLKINYNENYQLFYLKKSINEILNNKKSIKKINIRIDHINGYNYVNNLKIPLTFPLYLLNYIKTLNKEKKIEYNFLGTITDDRKWIKKYKTCNSIIHETNVGRNKNKKYEIDKYYYNVICKSKFTLTPTGDCPWSYRFFEAIMCLSIPVLDRNSNDIFMKDYYCLYDNDIHIYDKNIAIKNYNTFINSKHFLKNINNFSNNLIY